MRVFVAGGTGELGVLARLGAEEILMNWLDAASVGEAVAEILPAPRPRRPPRW